MTSAQDISLILKALRFSAAIHRHQRRKGAEASPYINHPIDVAETLWNAGGIRDPSIIVAAILHDTVEDTDTTPAEIDEQFGATVRALVEEVTDDKSLPKAERKQRQVEHAPHLSHGAKQIKLADKISNVNDMAVAPPSWSLERMSEYLGWAENVVAGLRGCNPQLEELFDETVRQARAQLREPSREMIDHASIFGSL